MPTGFDAHRGRLLELKARAQIAGVAAVRAGQAPIVTVAQEEVTKRTGILESTIIQHDPIVAGSVITGSVTAGSPETLSGWPSNRKGHIHELHGEGGRAGVGPVWEDVGREIFQEFGTVTNTPAVHYMEDATTEAMQGMGERMGEAFRGALA